jgi:enolase-phosphatase E1
MDIAQVVLLDIEGTTTPIDFVYKTLFPYARAHAREFLVANAHTPEVADLLCALSAEQEQDAGFCLNPPEWRTGTPQDELESAIAYVYWLMDKDRKSTPLKTLQGMIWKRAYEEGSILGELYPDVLPALRRWKAAGLRIAIFSSGSVAAQQLLFGHSTEGDLRHMFSGWFDTKTGSKRSADSYRRIAAELNVATADVLFISDVAEELDAAREAGMLTLQSVRPGMVEPSPARHRVIHTFEDIQVAAGG